MEQMNCPECYYGIQRPENSVYINCRSMYPLVIQDVLSWRCDLCGHVVIKDERLFMLFEAMQDAPMMKPKRKRNARDKVIPTGEKKQKANL